MRYLLIVFLLTSCSADFEYPATKKERTNYNLHGTTVMDPYFYMEDFESPYAVQWSDQQNALIKNYLQDSEITNIQSILTEAYSSEYYSLSFFNPDSDYYFYNSGAEQHHLYMKKGEDAAVILDPNIWAEDQTLNLDKVSISPNKKYLAYSVSDGGVDWRTIKLMDLETNENLGLEITEVKFSDITWKADSSGFYFNKYPKPLPENRLSQQSYDAAIYFADIETGEEKLFYGEINPEQNYTVSFIGDDKDILINVITGSEDENFYLYGNSPQALEPITPINQANFSYVHADNEGLFFITNFEADNYRLVKILFADYQLIEIIPEKDFALKGVSFVNEYAIADYINHSDMRSAIVFFNTSGEELDISLPDTLSGTISGFQSAGENTILFSLNTYTQPTQYYSYDVTEASLDLIWEEIIPGFNPKDYVEVSTNYKSKDGTMVPITYSYKSSTDINKDTPIFLYAYGGYNISIRPSFTPKYAAWLELGGVLAVANIRGGGEFGKAWHNAGKLSTKQNVFDDFLYASKFLEENSIGNRKSTAISGRSNGGLLVGTTLVQNPNYFGAALPAVGVMDMIRFTEFTEGWGWRGDYGSPILNQTDFHRNFKISPYHQTKIDVCYSPTLTTTGRRDDRVVPSHSYKFTARLQEYQGCTNPVMLYDATRAGHGSGNGVAMPKWKRIELFSIEQSFALKNIKQ